jgi:hypothetical protein
MNLERRKYVIFGVLGALSLILDQWTKVLAREKLRGHEMVTVVKGFFNLRYSENTGVAFGMFQTLPGGRILLTLVAVVAFVLVLHYLRKTEAKPHPHARGAGAGGRRRHRQPHRPHPLRARHRLHRLALQGATSGPPSTSPTRRSWSAWGLMGLDMLLAPKPAAVKDR